MATTKGKKDITDVWNMALSHLGMPGVSDTEVITPSSKAAIFLTRFYNVTRNAVLRKHEWNFATYNIALTEASGVTAPNGWDYAYEYPVAEEGGSSYGAVFIRKVYTDTESAKPAAVEYKLFHVPSSTGGQQIIACNYESAYAEITIAGDDDANVATPAPTFPGQGAHTYDPMFILAWSHLLAAYVAVQLTGSKEKKDENMEAYNYWLEQAKLADANEENIDEYDEHHQSNVIDAR